MTEMITINKSEFDDLIGLKKEIKDIKENYISRDEIDDILETIEILSDEKMLSSIRKSEAEIKEGKLKKAENFKEILNKL